MSNNDLEVKPTEENAKIEEADEDMLYTQALRKRVIDKLLEENMGQVPTDKEGAQILAAFLDGIDRQSVAKQRIKISKKDSQSNEQIAKVLEEMSRRRNTGEHIEIDITPSTQALSREALFKGDFLPAPTVVAGELIPDQVQETPDQFFKRVEEENPDILTGAAISDEDDDDF